MINQEKRERKNKRMREWRARDLDGARAKQRAYYHENKDKFRKWRMSEEGRTYKRRYTLVKYSGMTFEQYDALFKAQNGLCALCLKPEMAKNPLGTPRELNIDHCHKTGRIRGLLCRNCNVALGMIYDDVALLKRAITYLECNSNPPQL